MLSLLLSVIAAPTAVGKSLIQFTLHVMSFSTHSAWASIYVDFHQLFSNDDVVAPVECGGFASRRCTQSTRI
jgi:hypothetical protein